jgi:hypothetical protein
MPCHTAAVVPFSLSPPQVHTIERRSRSLRLVGCALLALFLDPKAGGQPLSRSLQDYVLNSGAFQARGTNCLN